MSEDWPDPILISAREACENRCQSIGLPETHPVLIILYNICHGMSVNQARQYQPSFYPGKLSGGADPIAELSAVSGSSATRQQASDFLVSLKY